MTVFTESKSAESRPAEPSSWIPAKLEIPKQLRFWEANEQRKADEGIVSNGNAEVAHEREYSDFEGDLMFKEHTVDAQTPKGLLSPAAINTIEQFSRFVVDSSIMSRGHALSQKNAWTLVCFFRLEKEHDGALFYLLHVARKCSFSI